MAESNYTSLYSVMNDATMYYNNLTGGSFTLGNIQSLAINRWDWLVSNFESRLQDRFELFAGGEDRFNRLLGDLKEAIRSYRLGSRRNPMEDLGSFIDFSRFLDLITVDELSLTADERRLVEKERRRVENFDIDDFRAMLDFIRQESALAEQAIGLGDDKGAELFGIEPISQDRAANISDLIRLQNTEEIKRFIEGLIIDLKQSRDKPPNLLEVANDNLDPLSNASFNDAYLSSVAVPFEISLEHMAKKYLGSTDLYYELITVNKLQPPYVDESGERFNLLAPGAVNNVIIPDDRKEDISVGTKVMIGSLKVPPEPRIVERVTENQDGTMILFLSGEQDLSKLKTSEKAYVRVFEPNTVNPGDFVLIPLEVASPVRATFTPESDELRRLSEALLNFGVDIARDEKTNGLVVSSNGDFRHAAGLANVRQAVLFSLKTRQGELPFHPDYGVNINIGARYFGTPNEATIFANLLRSSLLKDPRFSDVKISQLSTTNTGIALTMVVSIEGVNSPIPLSFVS